MNELYIFTGGSGTIGKKYIRNISKINQEILNIDLFPNDAAKYNITEDLSKENVINSLTKFFKDKKSPNIIKFVHLASIVGESQNKNWVTDISNLGIKKSEECYTISVTIPAKLISIFTEFAETKAIYINSIYGTHPPDFSIYGNNPFLQNPMSYGSIKAAQLYSIKWLNTYYKGKLRLNSVSPGGIESQNMDENFKKLYKGKTLGGSFSSTDDVIKTSEFLLSKEAKSIFGQNIFVDYGFR